MAIVHGDHADPEFDYCGAERDHNAGRMCDMPDERVHRVEMGRIPKKGGHSEMLIMEEQSEDNQAEVKIYLRKKRETTVKKSQASGFWCCAMNMECLANYFNKLIMFACCFACCFGVGGVMFVFAHHIQQEMPDPSSYWVATSGHVVSYGVTLERCAAIREWWRILFNMDGAAEDCCELQVQYAASNITPTLYYSYSNGDVTSVCKNLNGTTMDVYYQPEAPGNVIQKDRYDCMVDHYTAGIEAAFMLMMVGFGMASIYVCVFLFCCCFYFSWLCGCLPKQVQYYTTYGLRDFCGRDKQQEEQHQGEMENEGRKLLEDALGEEYELVNPDETRESLKDEYEKSKSILIGKQLLCIQHSEELFNETEKWCERNRNKPKQDDAGPNGREDGGPSYRSLWLLMDGLKLGMTTEEQDPNHQVLEEFRKSFSNHLVHEFDPTDTVKRLEATTRLCMAGNMKYEDAELYIQKSFKLRAKVLADEICSTITDPQSKKVAIQKVAASGATWTQAAKYVSEALEGKHKDKAGLLDSRNYNVETLPLNRERRKRYIPLKEWWEANNLILATSIANNPVLSNVLNQKGMGRILPTSFLLDGLGSAFGSIQDIEDYRDFSARIEVINHQYEELRVLMDDFLNVQTRWAVYLKLCNSAAHVDNDKNQRILRQQVRKELHTALGELLVDMMSEEDKNELHKLLQEMENVDIQTDEYVHRLEDNLKEIAVAEDAQCEDIKVQLKSFQRINNRMSGVLKGIQENTDRVLGLVTVQTRIRNCGYFAMLLTVVALVIILFEDQIFGTT